MCFFDMKRIITESDGGKEAQIKLKAFSEAQNALLANKGKELQELGNEIKARTQDDKRREQLSKDYQRTYAEYTKLKAQTQTMIQAKDKELTREIAQAVQDIAQKLAKKKKIDYIVEKTQSGVVILPPDSDITDAVIQAYDDRYEKGSEQ